jgi:hypothetical protein
LRSPLPSCLGERAISGHESLDHWGDQLCRVRYNMARRPTKRLSIGDEVAMDGGGKIDAYFDWLVVRERPEFEFRHGFPP